MKDLTIQTTSSSLQLLSSEDDIDFSVNKIAGIDFASVRSSFYQKAGEHGALLANNLYGERRIIIEGIVKGGDAAGYEANRRALAEILGLERDENGDPVLKTLLVTTNDDLSLQWDFIPAQEPKIEIEYLAAGRFFLDLVGDYLLESQTLKQSTLTPPTGGGIVYPVIYPVLFAATTGGAINVVNAGNCEAYPIITLNGPLTNPRIFNWTSGLSIALSLTLADGEQIVIDMKNKTIVQGGITNRLDKRTEDSDWWWLEKGSNSILLTTSSSGDSGEALIEFRDAYLGI
ncbi:MAG: hypothetical protein A2Y57_04115 [Candidatus Woykebacteria bacterium RBG_13_40_7b]|uniref:Siphovirus-type tail component C-terminal domain-containing protein n=1 Tax=Candidatus Woykebacteria bacterium RBG_13_40_7b TaxID=1802594 RepID=A0A1G1W9A7_9BACT|nr:MAG: hypothetical protein A2Y57_04115 [Candidatus Woykebacteria bacterium RBG_13_40_7b]